MTAVSTAVKPLGRDFLLLWSGSGLAVLAERFSAVPFTLLVVYAGYPASTAGLVSFAALLPMLLVQLPAGVLVDRWDRRWMMIVADAVRLLGIGSVAAVLLFGSVWVPHLMIVAFVQGSLTVCYLLAERAAVRAVVDRSHLPVALSRNEARGRAAALAGHPVGGSLFQLGVWVPFLSSAVLYLLSLVTLLFIRKPMSAPRKKSSSPWADVVEGVSWTWRQKYLRIALLLIAGSNMLFQGIILALQIVIKEDGRSPVTVGLILAAGGAGGILGALIGGRWVQRTAVRHIMVITHIAWALTMPLLALVRAPVLLGALFLVLSVIGAAVTVAGSVHQIQITPDRMQGRVGSVVLLLVSGASALGALSSGYLLQALGTTRTLLVFGGVMVVLSLVAVLVFVGRRAAEYENGLSVPV